MPLKSIDFLFAFLDNSIWHALSNYSFIYNCYIFCNFSNRFFSVCENSFASYSYFSCLEKTKVSLCSKFYTFSKAQLSWLWENLTVWPHLLVCWEFLFMLV